MLEMSSRGGMLGFRVLCAAVLLACGEAKPRAESETHFLRLCEMSCGSGLSCICGVCTEACSETSMCAALSSAATCVATSAACGTSVAMACEMTCAEDADCRALGAAHRCTAGYCRAGSNAVGAPAQGGAGSGSAGQSGHGALDPRAYSVTIEAEVTTLCPGECTVLRAVAANGVEPYRYAWSGADTTGPQVEVCPVASTDYRVTVTDSRSALGDEFGGSDRAEAASLEIVVDPDCGKAPPPGDVVPSCELRIPHSRPNTLGVHTAIESQAMMATDAQGNALLVGAFQGRIDFGNEVTATSRGIADGFVLKLSASCRPLWVVHFGAERAVAGLSGIALDAAGEMFVIGSFTGAIDFGDGAIATDRDSVVVLKLDANAELIWKRVYRSAGYASVALDLGVTDGGDVVFGGYGGPDLDFGGGPIGGVPTSSTGMSFVARLSGDGDHRYSHAVRGGAAHSTLAVHGSGLVAVSGVGLAATELAGTSVTFDPANGHFVAVLDDAGALLRSRSMPLVAPPPGGMTTAPDLGGRSVVYGRDRSLYLEVGNLRVERLGVVFDDPQRIVKLDASLAEVLSIERAYIGDDAAGFYGGLALDSQGNIILIDQISEGAYVDGQPIAGAGSHDVYVEKLSPQGELIWSRVLGAETLDRTWTQAIDVHDSIWVAYAEGAQYQAPHTVSVIRKLAP
jgi:hypothetical protein